MRMRISIGFKMFEKDSIEPGLICTESLAVAPSKTKSESPQISMGGASGQVESKKQLSLSMEKLTA